MFLKRLQDATPAAKQRWLVGLSAAAMLVVIVVWLKYFNPLAARAPEAERAGGFSFWEAAKNAGDYAAGTVTRWFKQ